MYAISVGSIIPRPSAVTPCGSSIFIGHGHLADLIGEIRVPCTCLDVPSSSLAFAMSVWERTSRDPCCAGSGCHAQEVVLEARPPRRIPGTGEIPYTGRFPPERPAYGISPVLGMRPPNADAGARCRTPAPRSEEPSPARETTSARASRAESGFSLLSGPDRPPTLEA